MTRWNPLWNPRSPLDKIAGSRKDLDEWRERKKNRRQKRKERGAEKKSIHPFYSSQAWRVMRYKILKKHNATCQCCGRSARDGVVINVDHIKPVSRFPELALDESNLQVLCALCNGGKLSWDQTDWRDPLEAEFKAVLTE